MCTRNIMTWKYEVRLANRRARRATVGVDGYRAVIDQRRRGGRLWAYGPCVFWRWTFMKEALYEAVLRDVGRYEELARRAEGFADDELAGFFRDIRDEKRRRADEARRLLGPRGG